MENQIAQLIKTLRQGIQALPKGVELMVHQYVVTGYVFAIIFGVLTLVMAWVAFHTYSKANTYIGKIILVSTNTDCSGKPVARKEIDTWSNHGAQIAIVGVATWMSVMLFSFSMQNLYHALNPIVSLISQVK